MRRAVLAVIAVFLAWSMLDSVLHGLILRSTYEATAELWRPMEEMKMNLMRFVVLAASIVFVAIYACFFREKSVKTGLLYGLLFGLGGGISMGYGTYAVMPIPYLLALGWFLGTLVEAVVGGLLVGVIVEPTARQVTPEA